MPGLVVLLITAVLDLTAVSVASAQWQAATAPSAGSINSFALLGNKIFAGTQQNGVLVSSDEGATWSLASDDLSDVHVTALATSGADLYAGTFYAQIYRSTDSGISWTLLNTGAYDEVRAFEVTNGAIFAATGLSGVLRSTTQGDAWTKASTGITSKYINDFATIGSTIYASGSGVFRSTNNGISWSKFSSGLTDTNCAQLAVIGSDLYVATATGIFVSNDGSAWRKVANLLPPYSVSVPTLFARGNHLFAGTFYGVFESYDGGGTWNAINEGLTDSTSPCRLSSDNTDLLLGTFIGAQVGIWHRPLSDFGISSSVPVRARDVASAFVWPNPVERAASITFTSKHAGYAEVLIANLRGIQVARIYSGPLTAGSHTVTWETSIDPSTVPFGFYECLIRTADGAQCVPIVVIQ